VSFDGPAENKAFAEKLGYTFPLLCDTERKLGLAYKACDRASDAYARRYTYVIGPSGLIEEAIDTKEPGAQAAALLARAPRALPRNRLSH
jgi:peroxiredoxin